MRRIRVTEADIAQGSPSSAYSCPVALAVKRELNKHHVGVCHEYIRIGESTIENPARTRRFVSRFDRGLPVTPFEFNLAID